MRLLRGMLRFLQHDPCIQSGRSGARLDSAPAPPYRRRMTIQPYDSLLIVHFGSQVTQLHARRVREAGVYSELAPFSQADAAFHQLKPRGIILSRSHAGMPYDEENGSASYRTRVCQEW